MAGNRWIGALARDLRPVKPVLHPLVSAVIWTAASMALIATGVALSKIRPDAGKFLADRIAVGEVAIAAVTAILAAIATFQVAIPGRNPLWAWMPILSAALWLAWLGVGCWRDFVALGSLDPRAETSASCLKFIAAFGMPAMLAAMVLARHGFALSPVKVSLLAGLAGAAAADVGLAAIDHPHAPLTSLIWHGGAAIFLIGAAALLGPVWMRRSYVWFARRERGGPRDDRPPHGRPPRGRP